MQPLRLATVSTLYPNREAPAHGVFVETRLRHLLAAGGVTARVVAPVPWFPLRGARFGSYGAYARVPDAEVRQGIEVTHPRYLLLPKIGMSLAVRTLGGTILRELRRLEATHGPFDLIDAHYAFPDGVAAVWAGLRLGRPVVVTARGTDLNLIPRYRLPRALLRWSARHAAALVTVAAALKDEWVRLGVPPEHVTVLRNGVDLTLFRPPADREAARAALGLGAGPALASVGLLIERKGHHHAIAAMADLPGATLLIAGEGPDRAKLEAQAAGLGVADRVRFLGRRPQAELASLYGACDALILASSREGWANVLLESMACGTPVVASAIWGTPEVVAAPEAGVLMPELSPAGIVAGVRALLAHPPDRAATRAYAERFSWDATTEGQLALFRRVLGREGGA